MTSYLDVIDVIICDNFNVSKEVKTEKESNLIFLGDRYDKFYEKCFECLSMQFFFSLKYYGW